MNPTETTPSTHPTISIERGVEILQKLYDTAAEYLVKYGFDVLGGLIILFVGFKLADWVSKLLASFCQQKKLDIILTRFLTGIVRIIIIVFAVLMAVEKFGVTISPLIASVSALIFGASFAIQAPLSNFAAGLVVILTRPFAVGNTISVQGVSGVVHEVKLPCTVLINQDGERITIPNKEIVGQILSNSAENRIVETRVGISYKNDPSKAIQVLTNTLAKHPKVAKTPPPQIGIEAFADSSINIGLRYWAPTMEYYVTLYSVNLEIHKALKEADITIPYPQREVRTLTS